MKIIGAGIHKLMRHDNVVLLELKYYNIDCTLVAKYIVNNGTILLDYSSSNIDDDG